MQTPTPVQLKAEITRRNKAYKKATPAQKRVPIMQNIISNKGTFIP